jgi:hypothetical protein
MCELYHPVWRAIAREARSSVAVVKAARANLAGDPYLRGLLGTPAAAKVLRADLGRSAAEMDRVLAGLAMFGVLVGQELAPVLPDPGADPRVAEGALNPETARKRRYRARLKALLAASSGAGGGELSTGGTAGTGPGHVPECPGDSGTSVPERPGNSGTSVPDAGSARGGIPEGLQWLRPPVVRPHGEMPRRAVSRPSGTFVPFPVNEKESLYEKKKEPAVQAENGAGAVPFATAPGLAAAPEWVPLTPGQQRKIQWLHAIVGYAQTVLPNQQWAKLADALPNAVVLDWARDPRGMGLPKWAKHQLEALNRRRKGLPPAAPGEGRQPALLLPLAGGLDALKTGLGVPGSDTLAPVEGELPQAVALGGLR